jgi:diguanylate cyclase (GGDEF)-like protein
MREREREPLPRPVLFVIGASVIVMAAMVGWQGVGPVDIWRPAAAAGLVCAGTLSQLLARVRSVRFGDTWTDAAFVLALVLLPAGPWVPTCVGAGMLAGMLALRRGLVRSAYNTATFVLAAIAGAGLADVIGWRGDALTARGATAAIMAVLVFVVTTAALSTWVVSCVSGETYQLVARDIFRRAAVVGAGNVAVALLILWLATTPRALVVVAPLMWLMHRHYRSTRAHERQERALERLSAATRGSVTLDEKDAIRHALADAISLWSPDAVELVMAGAPGGAGTSPTRWLLLTGGEVSSSPAEPDARRHPGSDFVVERQLIGRDTEIGQLRLVFRRKIDLAADERRALDLFTSALGAAIDNARLHRRTDEARAAQIVLRERAEHTATANQLLAERMRGQVEEMAALAAQHEHDASHDQLTDLANRRLLAARIEEAVSATDLESMCCGLLVVDVRDFKAVNTTLGPRGGNQLLLAITKRLQGAVRADDLVGRIGGDEFAVLLRDFNSPQGAAAAAAAIVKELEVAYDVARMSVKVEMAAGIATAPWDATTSDELLRCAEVALQLSKQRRRRGVERYEREQDPGGTEQVTLLDELDAAMRDSQLLLHYQPKFDLLNGRILGVEALIRWQHPHRGLLAPAQFMPAIERTAAMSEVTHYVLNRALAQQTEWTKQGVSTPVAVNISARDLHDPDLPRSVQALLELHDVPASRLTLELTETAASGNLDAVASVLEELRALQVKLSCDDFGTGYSSLSMLARYPLTELKIDRSFVSGIMTDRRKQLLVNTAIDAARNFGLDIVAEGIETPDQQQALVARGCTVGQGYLLSKPVPPFAITDVLRRRLRVA